MNILKIHLPRRTNTLVIVLVAALIGTVLILTTRAATPYASPEPEGGSSTSPAGSTPDATAAGRSAIQLSGQSAGGGTLSPQTAPQKWIDVGVLGYFDNALGRRMTYADLRTDLTPLLDAGIIRPYKGSTASYEVIEDGAEIVGYDFPEGSNIRIAAANVSLKKNRIRAGHSTVHQGAVFFQRSAPATASDGSLSTVVLEDNEIVGGDVGIYSSWTGVRLIARRNVIAANTIDPATGRATSADLNMGDGIDWRGTYNDIDNEAVASIVEQNWVGGFHRLEEGSKTQHYDGLVSVGGGNIKWLYNRIEGYGMPQNNSIRIVSDITSIKNVWAEGNVSAGWGFQISVEWGDPVRSEKGDLTNIYIRNNVSEAGTYQWGPFKGGAGSIDRRTGLPAVSNLVLEGNYCIDAPDPSDVHDRHRSLSAEEIRMLCNEKLQ